MTRQEPDGNKIALLRERLGTRSIVMIGLMGCGKSSIGKRLAARMGLAFVDADDEIELAHRKSITEIFADHGEPYFRDGERKVIARLLATGPRIVATGGGAFMNAETRAAIREAGISVWLRAELPVLMRRVMRRDNRPLLKTADPEAVMRGLIEARYPVYADADVIVESREVPHETIVAEIIDALAASPVLDSPRRSGDGTIRSEPNGSIETSNRVRVVPVPLGGRAYDVLIGPALVADAGRLIGQKLPKARCGVVTDENVSAHHLAALEASLKRHGIHAGTIRPLRPGEATKCFAELARLSEGLLEMGLERGDLVVALGGGVIGDLAGFAASILRRGIRFVQIPTTLLAQVDSSVGGKTGINTPQGKNLIGAFHQPSLVLADTDVLSTLPLRELRAGYAEVAKYGLLGDAAFFSWLEASRGAVFGNDIAALTHAIETSVKMKSDIVVRDETEAGDRALLNLGHTFGHALEAFCGYSSRLLHGEAVAIGMVQAFRFSERCGHCAAGTAERVESHLLGMGLPTRMSQIPGDKPDSATLVRLMGQDKKVRAGKLTFILVRGIGEAFIARDVPGDDVRAFLDAEIAAGR